MATEPTAVTWKKTAVDRRQDGKRYGRSWRKARREQLERDRYRCQIRLDGCTTIATTVDHIHGAANDPNHLHLRSACENCHGKTTAQQGRGYRKPATERDPEPRTGTTW